MGRPLGPRPSKAGPLPERFWSRPAHWIAGGGGAGACPLAPGTCGTLVGVAAYWLLAPLPLPAYVGVWLALGVVGVWACEQAGRAIGVHDHGAIVIDEIVGYLVAMTAVPPAWPYVLGGFVLFRIFDILKPWPIRWIDRRVPGGVGVMLDDVLAGVYSAVAIQIVLHSNLIS